MTRRTPLLAVFLRAPRRVLVFACLSVLMVPRVAAADDKPAAPAPPAPVDRFDFRFKSDTYAQLFRRALQPGTNGSLVETDTSLPVHEYVYLGAHDLDTSWKKDAIDVELAAWGRVWMGENSLGTERRLDGDIQTANVRYHQGPVSVRVGRQHAAGGAARYVRFDGAMVNVALGKSGLELEGYGGFTVLPRWDSRPGYHHLGAASDNLLRTPEAMPQPDRSGYTLAGGRLGWTAMRAQAGVSFHQQQEPTGLARRTAGADGRVFFVNQVSLGANTLLDLDALRLQDARLWVDAAPTQRFDLSVEVLHTEPALFLSRQSVLSVFSTAAYEEAGGTTAYRWRDWISTDAGGWVQFYDEAHRGARGDLGVRLLPSLGRNTIIRVGYGRVIAIGNGYHSVRASVLRKIVPKLTATFEVYGYLYDKAILDRTTSSVLSATLGYQATPSWNVLWGASLAQSPYASVDAQSLVRVSYVFDATNGSVPR